MVYVCLVCGVLDSLSAVHWQQGVGVWARVEGISTLALMEQARQQAGAPLRKPYLCIRFPLFWLFGCVLYLSLAAGRGCMGWGCKPLDHGTAGACRQQTGVIDQLQIVCDTVFSVAADTQ
jgi:hypothetical protein